MNKYLMVKQEDLKDCGVSSLLMIIRTYGGNASREYLRYITHTDKDGTSFYNLMEAAKKFNFNSFGLSGNLEDLDIKYLPVIAHVVIDKSYQHFVVIYEINKTKNYVVIADPACGIKKLSFDDFNNISTNKFLIFEPFGKILNMKMVNPIKNILRTYIVKNKYKILLIILFSIIYTLLSIIFTFYFQIILTNYLDLNFISIISLMFIFISLFKSIFNYIRYKILIKINNDLDKFLFKKVYHHIFSLPYYFYKTRTTGEILSRINDLSNIKDTISNFIISVLIDLFLSFISLIFLFKINVKLALIVIFFVFIYFLIFIIFKNKVIDSICNVKDSNIRFNSYLADTIKGIESIKNINREEYVFNLFDKNYNDIYSDNYKFNNICNREMLFKNIVDALLDVIVITVGVLIIRNNNLNISDLVTFIFLMSLFIGPIKNIFNFFYEYQNSKESINRIKDLFEVEEEMFDNKCNLIDIHSIKFSNLSYSYKKADLLLNNINMEIKKAEKILLCGNSGCGKSTLMKILNGYIKEYDGCVYLNDVNINNIDRNLLNRSITYVSQNETLFNMSLKDNIILGRDIDDIEFLKVCNLLSINNISERSFLAYDFMLEEDGANLSGGERQRVIIARSILKKSDVYIFDESLCNMDIELERDILINLFNYLKDKIVIVVSHRFYNSDLFDKRIKIGDDLDGKN